MCPPTSMSLAVSVCHQAWLFRGCWAWDASSNDLLAGTYSYAVSSQMQLKCTVCLFIFIYCVGVCMHMCTLVMSWHVKVRMYMCLHACTGPRLLPSLLNLELTAQLFCLPACSPSPCSTSQGWGCRRPPHPHSFDTGYGYLNSGLHACAASTFEPHKQF